MDSLAMEVCPEGKANNQTESIRPPPHAVFISLSKYTDFDLIYSTTLRIK